ncbi:uncharacterized protein VTP21DRAFT_854 [Calcarisporiella thermophila]|uniref:uncharacterized protein n=1 Tax=Calcarisporiella thermophila TaxID=911321 RepID=UPI003743FD99
MWTATPADTHPPNNERGPAARTLLELDADIFPLILDYLDARSITHLSRTNRFFYAECRKYLAFHSAQWILSPSATHNSPPALHARGAALVGMELYVPFLTTTPACYILDLKTMQWRIAQVHIDNDLEFRPFVAPVVSVGRKLYLFGGRKFRPYQLSNDLYVLDTETMHLRRLTDIHGTPPKPRHEHSFDVVLNRYLITFGGIVNRSLGENDVFVFDIDEEVWHEPMVQGQKPYLRFGHSTAVIDQYLYVYGGTQLYSHDSSIVFDDFYRLDCSSFQWHKIDWYHGGSEEQSVISATGPSPLERFECGMVAVGQKLLIFGGRTFTMDSNDRAILVDYPLQTVDIYHTRSSHWSRLIVNGCNDGAEMICAQDLTCMVVPPMGFSDGQEKYVLVIGQQKSVTSSSSGESQMSEGSTGGWEAHSPPAEASASLSSSSSSSSAGKRSVLSPQLYSTSLPFSSPSSATIVGRSVLTPSTCAQPHEGVAKPCPDTILEDVEKEIEEEMEDMLFSVEPYEVDKSSPVGNYFDPIVGHVNEILYHDDKDEDNSSSSIQTQFLAESPSTYQSHNYPTPSFNPSTSGVQQSIPQAPLLPLATTSSLPHAPASSFHQQLSMSQPPSHQHANTSGCDSSGSEVFWQDKDGKFTLTMFCSFLKLDHSINPL